MMYNYKTGSVDDLKDISCSIVSNIREHNINIVLFTGSMGAGKTTLIKEICRQMDVLDSVTSPTFALINEYSTAEGNPIYHFDVYRIDSIDEVIDIGYEEYIYSGELCFIEWWQKMAQLIPQNGECGINIAEIVIESTGQNSREIEVIIR